VPPARAEHVMQVSRIETLNLARAALVVLAAPAPTRFPVRCRRR
jgi:hypothetical protein